MTCIIVEDEPLARDRLKTYIGKTPGLELMFSTDNGSAALEYLKANATDLVFLDINISGISGIELLEDYDMSCAVIITTAYHEFAVKGFELNVTDYLLKPFSFERFSQAVEKAARQLASAGSGRQTHFFVRTEYRLEKIFFRDLLYIEGMRDYRKLFTTTRPVMTLQTFRDFEKEVPMDILCRVHKSFMVVIENIDAIEKNTVKIGGKQIPVSDTYRNQFLNIIRKS